MRHVKCAAERVAGQRIVACYGFAATRAVGLAARGTTRTASRCGFFKRFLKRLVFTVKIPHNEPDPETDAPVTTSRSRTDV